MKIPKKYYVSIVLVFLAISIIKTQFHFGDSCYGMVNGLLFLLLSFIYLVILIISISISTYNYFRKNQKFNFLPIIITAVTTLLLVLLFNSEKFESQIKYTAGNEFMGSTLTIKENNSFLIKRKHYEMTCVYKGDCKINNDTIELLRKDINTITDNIFFNKYLIREKKLLPLQENMVVRDSTKWLNIDNIYK